MTSVPRRSAALAAALLLVAAGLAALGVWQVERRAWKHALIAAVTERTQAAPVAAPGPKAWPGITAQSDSYRRIHATGRFLNDRVTLVRAVSDLGSGYWVVTPLDTGGFTVLVNRGFVPPESRDAAARGTGAPMGQVTITGLLRITEPGGGFLRANDPAGDRWYSRDVAAIAAARGLQNTAPYFIDAEASAAAPGQPVGGLTVIRFADNHLVYALTWFAMAALALWAAWRVRRPSRGAEA
ncbi:SURF1 family protein [Sphingomonas hengshuiensis]|uniref:SURF1-like protein n=1 Tax=Sphingomonas hengshuiensis TaxID=1609977 RepID=A0A7U5BE16_9SPHN|nr:SURF1 family protein [Sphingomonas hengshuiensis]AJP70597.1 Surfeit locus 1 family protein [Sphingomonas hengshuiensis]